MEDDQDLHFDAAHGAPGLVFLSSFSPSVSASPRRLSTHFCQPSRPVPAVRQFTWVSLQGRLIGAEESSSVRAIGGSLIPEESVAWELFSPIHRILLVAVVAVADSKKSRKIWQLKRSVDLRDQVLSSMQQKLDDLCEQVNTMKDRTDNWADISFTKNKELLFRENFKSDEVQLVACGCQLCNEHRVSSNVSMQDSVEKACGGDDVFKFKLSFTNGAEQEERRMSDLSDWASVTSSADIQLNTLAIEKDIFNLQKECEEKDTTIKELSAVVHASDVATSKRVAELEDTIRRKNMNITKLKKDMLVMEQKVVHLTRLQRPSPSASNSDIRKLPVMADNLIYNMDSSTSPSSSDSDSPSENQSRGPVHKDKENTATCKDIAARRVHTAAKANAPTSLVRLTDSSLKLRSVSPLKENYMNQRPDSTVMLRPRQIVPAGGDMRRYRRHTASRDAAPQKRWV